MHTSPRLAIPITDSGDQVHDYPAVVDQPAKAILDTLSVFSTGTLAALPSPTPANRRHYATDKNVELFSTGSQWIPVGTPTPLASVAQYAGSVDPVDTDGVTRWMVCDGRAINRTTFASLYTALGSASSPYGQGNGTTTFNIPDCRSRVSVGKAAAVSLGATGGEETHVLSAAGPLGDERPIHAHSGTGQGSTSGQSANHSHTIGGGTESFYVELGSNVQQVVQEVAGGTANTNEGSTGTESANHNHSFSFALSLNSTGGGGAHNNVQPYLVLNYVIKVL